MQDNLLFYYRLKINATPENYVNTAIFGCRSSKEVKLKFRLNTSGCGSADCCGGNRHKCGGGGVLFL